MRTPTLAVFALLGLVACDVDADGDGVAAQFDCDDTNPDINDDAPELCDVLDNNCDGQIDNDTTDAPTFYADFDRDGFGDPNTTTSDCRFDEEAGTPDPDFEPFGYVRDMTDCNDQLKTVNPEADERCDGIDNNCDGAIDDDSAVDKNTWFEDGDDDGYGDAASTTEACDQPAGYVDNDLDCNDDQDFTNPGADEICDSFDNDCDEEIDEDDAIDALAWYRDADEDGYGTPDDSLFACGAPDGYIADNTDCNDEAATANPGGTEVCDGLDNDCDSTTSEAGTVSLNASSVSYGTIQEAVDAAVDGDSVYVCEGVWDEYLEIYSGISLIGGGGSDLVVFDGGETLEGGTLVWVEAEAAVTIEGITIQNAVVDIDGEEPVAAGVSAYTHGGDLTIRDCVFDNNTGYIGGLIGPELFTTTVEDSRFTNNTANIGGGLVVFDADIKRTRILDNVAEGGGGMAAVQGTVTMEDVRIISNYAAYVGGGLYVVEADVDGGEILNNLSDDDGGGVWAVSSTLSNMDIKGNRTSATGGGVFVSSGVDMDSLVIDGNKAAWGGGISSYGGSWTAVSTDITNNEASNGGGGFYTDGGDVSLETCAVEGNTASDAGGGAYIASGTLDVTTSDWGTDTDGNNNDPDDIYAEVSDSAYTDYGVGETFSCDSSGSCL